MRPSKPEELLVGRAYRIWLPFCAGPSDQIAVVTGITRPTKTTRQVQVEWLLGRGMGWSITSYSEFMGMVFREEPTAVQ